MQEAEAGSPGQLLISVLAAARSTLLRFRSAGSIADDVSVTVPR